MSMELNPEQEALRLDIHRIVAEMDAITDSGKTPTEAQKNYYNTALQRAKALYWNATNAGQTITIGDKSMTMKFIPVPELPAKPE